MLPLYSFWVFGQFLYFIHFVMMELYQDQKFEQVDFTQRPWEPAEFEHCTFDSCHFLECNLSASIFSQCTFRSCDLSMVQLYKTAWRKTSFFDCKLLGVDFSSCNPIGLELSFYQCFMQLANLSGLRIPAIRFERCQMQEVQFLDTNLQSAQFDQCDLQSANFDGANLAEADLSTSVNFIINPDLSHIKGAKFSMTNALNLLSKYQIKIVDL